MDSIDLFVPCLTDTFHPRAAAATVSVLEHLGVEVRFPLDQTCCGQAHANAGCTADASALVRRMARIFAGDRPVVTPSGSCAAMAVRHAPGLVPAGGPDADAVRSLAGRVREFSQYLVDDLGVDLATLGARFPGSEPGRPVVTAVHRSCHSRDLGTTDEAERLLRGIEGLQLRPVPAADRCCGFGGAFAVDEPEISSEMGRDKARAVALTGAELLVTGDSGCALQIHGTLLRSGRSIRVAHVAEVIAESLDLEILGEPAPARGGER